MKPVLTLLAFVFCVSGFAQTKIGYTNIELVLAYMPETQAVDQELAIFQEKLSSQFKIKDDYLKQRYMEYQEIAATDPTDERLPVMEQEITKLDSEVKRKAMELEQQFLKKQGELMEPVLEKLQNAVDAVAEAEGLTLILNQTTSTGVSTILYGPDKFDMTEKIFNQLGIEVPEPGN